MTLEIDKEDLSILQQPFTSKEIHQVSRTGQSPLLEDIKQGDFDDEAEAEGMVSMRVFIEGVKTEPNLSGLILRTNSRLDSVQYLFVADRLMQDDPVTKQYLDVVNQEFEALVASLGDPRITASSSQCRGDFDGYLDGLLAGEREGKQDRWTGEIYRTQTVIKFVD